MAVDRKHKGQKTFDKQSDYVVVDIETTGLSPEKNKIIEIAALKVKNNEVVDKYEALINPEEKINYFITNLTGITNDMVKNKPTVKYVLDDFKEFVGDNIIVGHNVNFDINFLYDNLLREKNEYLTNDFVDTMYLGRKVISGLPNYKLQSISEYLNVEYKNAHRAINDCLFTFECYEKMKGMY